jgi:hypothetical protein
LANTSGVGWYSTLPDIELHCGNCPESVSIAVSHLVYRVEHRFSGAVKIRK